MRVVKKISRPQSAVKPRKKVAAYARVSVESERTHHSLSAQVSYYSGLIQKNPEWEYAGVYADYGISGTGIKKREEFRRMLEDAKAGKINLILTKSIQRFARNTVDLLVTVRHLKEIGVEVWFEKENIKTLSGDGELMLTILASFAQEESRSISNNVKWYVQKGFQQGIPNGHFRIYGYKWEGDKLVIVPEEAAVVRRIFQNFLDGKSRLETEREFEAEGIRTRQNCAWKDSNIKNVLENITYTGNMLLQKEYISDPITKKRCKNHGELPRYFVENTHEAIIDKATFDYVQKEMARRKALGPLANKSLATTCFTGKIKCGICGRSYMHSRCTHHGNYRDFWDCGSHKLKGKRCGAKGGIPEKVLEKECAEVLGLDHFEEAEFLNKVDHITVPEQHTLVFHMKDGREITRHWVSTAKKDCWTDEYKDKQRAWMKKYMADAKGTRFSVFTTRIKCAVCGGPYYRCTNRNKHGISIHWRCARGGKCSSVSILEADLKRAVAGAMETDTFEEEKFRQEVECVEVGIEGRITVRFKNGTGKTAPYVRTPKPGYPHTEEFKASLSRRMKEQNRSPEIRKAKSEYMKKLRKERGANWQKK